MLGEVLGSDSRLGKYLCNEAGVLLSYTGKRYNLADVSAAVCMSLGLIWFTLADSTIAPNFNLTGEEYVCIPKLYKHFLLNKNLYVFVRILNDAVRSVSLLPKEASGFPSCSRSSSAG